MGSEIRFFIHGIAAAQIAEKSSQTTYQGAMQKTTMKTALLSKERMVQDSSVTAGDSKLHSIYGKY